MVNQAINMAKQVQKMFGGGGLPRGTGLGLKLLGTAAVLGLGINKSMYTGKPVYLLSGLGHCSDPW